MADNDKPNTLDDLRALLDQGGGTDLTGLLEQLDAGDLARVAEQITTPGELGKLLELAGGDDALIDRFLDKAGADPMLDRVFELMPTRFVSERLATETGVVEWHIRTPEGEKVYHLSIAQGNAEAARGPAASARTTLTMSAADLLRLCAGTLNGVTAFMNGTLKLAGDMMFGAKLPAAFDTSAA